MCCTWANVQTITHKRLFYAPRASPCYRSEVSEKTKIGMRALVRNGPGVLHQLTGVIARFEGDITSVGMSEDGTETFFEMLLPGEPDELQKELAALSVVVEVTIEKSLQQV